MRTTYSNKCLERRAVRSGWIILGTAGVFFVLCLATELKNLVDFSRIMEPFFEAGDPKFYKSTWLEYGVRRSLSVIPRALVGSSAVWMGCAIVRKKVHTRIVGWGVCALFFFIGEFLFGILISSAYGYFNVLLRPRGGS